MIGLDTNILIRLLTRDEENQFLLCRKLVENADKDNALVVNPVVIAETIWVLEAKYGFNLKFARSAVGKLLNTNEFSVLENISVSPWSSWFTAKHKGIFDLLISEINKQNGCAVTYTLDKQAAKHVPDMELLA